MEKNQLHREQCLGLMEEQFTQRGRLRISSVCRKFAGAGWRKSLSQMWEKFTFHSKCGGELLQGYGGRTTWHAMKTEAMSLFCLLQDNHAQCSLLFSGSSVSGGCPPLSLSVSQDMLPKAEQRYRMNSLAHRTESSLLPILYDLDSSCVFVPFLFLYMNLC